MRRREFLVGLLSSVALPALPVAEPYCPFEFSGFYSTFPFDAAKVEFLEGMSQTIMQTLYYGSHE